MTISMLSIVAQTLDISNVEQLVLTDVVDDGTATGTFVRAIRMMGPPDPATNVMPLVMEIRIRSTTKLKLEVQTPAFTF